MKQICPVCEKGFLTEHKEDMALQDYKEGLSFIVKNCEYCTCSNCDAEPILPGQIKRNDRRIKRARTQARKEKDNA